jgi:hypothetical protein
LDRIQRNLNERCHVVDVAEKEVKPNANELSLTQFVNDFGEGLLERVAEQAPPLFNGTYPDKWDKVMDKLKRQPFAAQRDIVASIASLLAQCFI